MKVLFLSDNFPPEVNAPATRTFEHCVEWAKQGVEVTVITCQPNFPKGKVFEGYTNKLYQKETVNGIRVIRVWSYIAPNSGFLKRILDFISYAFMAFWVGLFIKTDIVIGTSPQFFTAIAARCLGFVKRIPWVMEVRDLWPESIAAVGAMKRTSKAYLFLERIETHLYRSANKIIVVTDAFKSYIAAKGISDTKIEVIKNGVDPAKFQPQEKDETLLEKYGLKNKFVVSYIGTHGMAHALDFILECAKEEKDPSTHFILQGDGAEKQNLLFKAKQEGLSNVSFLPFVSKSEIKKYISLSDVALVNLKRSDTFKTVIPSKIFENACMLKPILLGVEGESKEIIEHYSAGVAFKPESKVAFQSALASLKDQQQYILFQKGCEALTKDFNRSHLALKMLESIKKNIKIKN